MTNDIGSWFTFAGELIAERPPEFLDVQADTLDALLKPLGYHSTQLVGDPQGLHFELFETGDAAPRWLVVFSTQGHSCPIAVRNWPDLIELLSRLAPIALAAALPSAAAQAYRPQGPDPM